MAVVVTDLRNSGAAFNEADSITGWVGGVTLYTSAPTPAEASGCVGDVVSSTTTNPYVVATSVDLTDSLVYIWVRPFGTMDTFANGGVGIVVGDGTNRMAYYVGGSDRSGFRHAVGPIEWTCFILDTGSLPTGKATIAGSEASMTWTAITDIGVRFKTLAKALGNVENCFIDVIRVGTEGLQITGGGSGTEGNFTEVTVQDALTTDGYALGIARLLATGVVGLQGPLTLGDATGTGSIDFESTGETVAFEPPVAGIDPDHYWIKVVSNSTGTTSVVVVGGNWICPSGSGGELDASDADVETFSFTGGLIKGYEAGITLSDDATNGPNHNLSGAVLDGCGPVDPGRVDFTGMTIIDPVITADNSAILWDRNLDPDGYLDDLTITKGSTAHHALELGTTSPTEVTVDGWTTSGFNASNGQNDSTFHVLRTSGDVTINVVGGTGNFSYKTAGATVTVVQAKSATFTPIENGSAFTITRNSDNLLLTDVPVTSGGQVVYSYDGALDGTAATVHLIIVGKEPIDFLWTIAEGTVPISQITDRVYDT